MNKILTSTLFLLLVCITCFGQWRTSFDTFVKDIDEYPLSDVPYAKPDAGGLTGQRISGDAAIMQRFGGKVEFEGTFQGVVTGDSFLDPQKKIKKIDISMAWPSGRNPSGYWSLHLYPKAGSLKAWRALKSKTTVKFRAVVTGITWYQVWIPGLDHAFSILLEDGEIISKMNPKDDRTNFRSTVLSIAIVGRAAK